MPLKNSSIHVKGAIGKKKNKFTLSAKQFTRRQTI